MTVARIVPNLFGADPRAALEFYAEVFDLDVVMDMGERITILASPAVDTMPQLSVFGADAEDGRDPVVSIEVDDVDMVHQRASDLGHEVVYSLRDEDWGVRRFMLLDPAGRVVNVLSHLES